MIVYEKEANSTIFYLHKNRSRFPPLSKNRNSELVLFFQFFSFHSHFRHLSIRFNAKLIFISTSYSHFISRACFAKRRKKIYGICKYREKFSTRLRDASCPQVQQRDGSNDPLRLSLRRSALSISWNLRYFYVTNSGNSTIPLFRSAISAVNFLRYRRWLSLPPRFLT